MSSLEHHKQELAGAMTFFKSWTEKSAYVMGMLFADGSIPTRNGKPISVTLELKDEDHLEKIANVIDPALRVYHHTRKDGRHSAKFQICRLCVVKDCMDMGITPRKSLSVKFPNTLPTELECHFVRGYLDGNGTISPIWKGGGKVSIGFSCGSPMFLKELRSKIKQYTNANGSVSHNATNGWSLIYNKKEDVTNIGNWMYSQGGLRLERKFRKWKDRRANVY